MTYISASELDFRLSDLPHVALPGRVLFTSPEFFQVEYVINPHMHGHVGSVDTELAWAQWSALKAAYDGIGIETSVQTGLVGMPDMVFCANQTLPSPPVGEGVNRVVLSRMYSEHRAPEVEAYARTFASFGYETLPAPPGVGSFEGMGDALWHPGRRLIWGGYGFRTDRRVYEPLSKALNAPVALIRLEDPDFYHLDTCLSVLSESSALIYPGAFDADGLSLVHALFEEVLEAPEDESRGLFACNAHCPDGKHVIIQRGCSRTVSALSNAGFDVIEVDTDEFLKAGGSVFCMKQMYW